MDSIISGGRSKNEYKKYKCINIVKEWKRTEGRRNTACVFVIYLSVGRLSISAN